MPNLILDQRPHKDHSGSRFHFLLAVRYAGHRRRAAYWVFRCDCGAEKTLNFGDVQQGATKSCGCKRGELISARRRAPRVAPAEKSCPVCKATKPAAEYGRNPKRHDGLKWACKACNNAYTTHPERLEKARAAGARYRASEKGRDRMYRAQYGITTADYRRLLAGQDGACAVCRRPPAGAFDLEVDHDHRTGAVRGLLCRACNNGIGKLGDSAAGVRAALAYLERAEAAIPGSPQPPDNAPDR